MLEIESRLLHMVSTRSNSELQLLAPPHDVPVWGLEEKRHSCINQSILKTERETGLQDALTLRAESGIRKLLPTTKSDKEKTYLVFLEVKKGWNWMWRATGLFRNLLKFGLSNWVNNGAI